MCRQHSTKLHYIGGGVALLVTCVWLSLAGYSRTAGGAEGRHPDYDIWAGLVVRMHGSYGTVTGLAAHISL